MLVRRPPKRMYRSYRYCILRLSPHRRHTCPHPQVAELQRKFSLQKTVDRIMLIVWESRRNGLTNEIQHVLLVNDAERRVLGYSAGRARGDADGFIRQP